MKSLLGLVLTMAAVTAFAQDRVVLQSGTTENCKVTRFVSGKFVCAMADGSTDQIASYNVKEIVFDAGGAEGDALPKPAAAREQQTRAPLQASATGTDTGDIPSDIAAKLQKLSDSTARALERLLKDHDRKRMTDYDYGQARQKDFTEFLRQHKLLVRAMPLYPAAKDLMGRLKQFKNDTLITDYEADTTLQRTFEEFMVAQRKALETEQPDARAKMLLTELRELQQEKLITDYFYDLNRNQVIEELRLAWKQGQGGAGAAADSRQAFIAVLYEGKLVTEYELNKLKGDIR
jgi:hypothetical protein